MKLRGAFGLLTALVALVVAAVPASADTGLNAYKARASSAAELQELKRQGFDLTEGQRRGGTEIIATKRQVAKLRRAGIATKLIRDRRGRTARRIAAAQAAGGWEVWRPWARTDIALSGAAGNPTVNIKTQMQNLARRYSDIAKLETIGHSINGEPIYAMKVTKGARKHKDGKRPAVLYSAVQHAREWLAGETERRTLRLFLDNYGRRGPALGTDGQPVEGVSSRELTKLVDTRELWFILVANPDGYDFTFTPENRLWRKNLRDNDGDGQITAIDGVDPNRNFPTRWSYDDEGSNRNFPSETYHGTGPASEPETKAFLSLMNRVNFAYNKNDHTAAKLILWPFGWQVDTRPADEPLMTALAGDDDHPGIETFDPDVGAELYTTNGDTNDHMYKSTRTISFTPEGSEAATGSVFVFQDSETDVQAEFERHVQFALDLARSADDPTRPESHLGNTVPNFVVDDFAVSFGNPQTVQANARRDLGRITLNYRVNGGRTQTKSTREWQGGIRYGNEGDYWYHRMRGQVTGTKPGDNVRVWFTSRHKKSDPFTYKVRSDSNADVLVLAVEDYSGNSALPAYADTTKPNYLSYYTDALQANGTEFDVYDYDAEGRKAPDALGVMSHYDAVIWYTGNDNITRAGATPGVADLEAHRTIISVRDFVNEGGRVALQGVHAGRQYDLVEYPQEGFGPEQCDGNLQTTNEGKCQPLSNDFVQYYLGGYLRSDAGGLSATGDVFPVKGTAGGPLDGLTLDLNGPSSAGNQAGGGIGTGNFLVTSSILDPAVYPQFESDQAADWLLSGGAAFDPHTGSKYMYSQNADEGYKRMTRTVDLTGVTGSQPANLSFWTSYNTELDWDFVFVEAHTVGQDDWTTLPDENGHTTQNTGSSCPAGWGQQLHFQLQHYQTVIENGPGVDDNGCEPVGTAGTPVGAWHASSGNSSGWQNWSIDLSAYRGKQVELSIVFATDWGTTTVPGVMLDDTTVTAGSNVSTTSFETQGDLGGWTIPGAHPAGPSTNVNDWIQSDRVPFEDAAVTYTDFGLMFGFGLEGVDRPANRAVLMERILGHLLN